MKRIVVFLFLLLLVTPSAKALDKIYDQEGFRLHLFDSGDFMCYYTTTPTQIIGGKIVMKNDSLVLTTHRGENETVIFGVYEPINNWQHKLTYLQPHFAGSINFLPATISLVETYDTLTGDFTKVEWINKEALQFIHRSYNEEKMLLAIRQYEGGLLHGEQMTFYTNHAAAPKTIEQYESGVAVGKWLYFTPADQYFIMMRLEKVEVYNKGTVRRTRTPATQPVFYTSHFLQSN